MKTEIYCPLQTEKVQGRRLSPKNSGSVSAGSDSPLVVAYGGGVNSTAMLVEFHRRGIRPNLILFADTGGERPETYETVRRVSAWCVDRGLPAIETVMATYQGKPETLEENCLRMKMLPSIAYGFKSCSLKKKVVPQDRFVNAWPQAAQCWESGGKVTKCIGYDAGEERRAKIHDDDKYSFWYPLIEWGFHREECVSVCVQARLPSAKSSCFFCPSMKKAEILELAKTHPDLMRRAEAMESNAELTSIKGLGRRFSWTDFVKADEAQARLFDDYSAPEIPCGCYDG